MDLFAKFAEMKWCFNERAIINSLTVASAAVFAYSVYVLAETESNNEAKDDITWLIGAGELDVDENKSADVWYRAEMNGRPIGYSHYQEIRSGESVLIFDVSRFVLGVMGTKKTVKTTTRAILDKNLKPKRFTFDLDAESAKFSVKGTIRDKTVELIIRTGDAENVEKIELKNEPRLEIDLLRRAAKAGFAPGKRFRTSVFNPQTLSEQEIEIEVIGREKTRTGSEEVNAWRVKQTSLGVTMEQWVNDDGEMLVATAPLGMRLVRTTRRSALLAFNRSNGEDIIEKSAVRVSKPFPDPKNLSRLSLKLTGIEFKEFEINTFRQKLDGDNLTISREKIEGIKSLQLPVKGDEFKEYLKREPLLQTDAPEIAATAKEIVGDEKEALKAAIKISGWVHANLAKENVVGVPSAVEVLKNRIGDCNEHSTLFVALARSAGIPARIASGVVSMGGSFFYHAWAEAFVGEWLSIDPTFDQIPADVSHLRLTTGGLEKQAAIMQLLGKLNIEVLSYETLGNEESKADGKRK
ncbi:MAG: hypothetical protein Kow0090_10940 [Myxococcota bacterium]